MGDVIFAEGNTTAHSSVDASKAAILEDMLGPLQDVVENAQGDHAKPDLFANALTRAAGLAYQWQEAVSVDGAAPEASIPESRADKVSKLFGVVSNIYDDASQGKQSAFDAQRASNLVAILDDLSLEV